MSRIYTELSCGCLVSCDGGGGLIPCESDDCRWDEWRMEHPTCETCGECLECFPDHERCVLVRYVAEGKTVELFCYHTLIAVGQVKYAGMHFGNVHFSEECFEVDGEVFIDAIRVNGKRVHIEDQNRV